MSKIEIDLSEEILDRIRKYIGEGRFKDLSDFFGQAAKLMLYSEDKKDEFLGVLKKGMDN
jgi:Arc/MetJ-type ribon-helix-helix transcriptional regulator